ncbi:MAG TPA: hypothetical protein EYQ84_08445 [Nitrospinaceae bacterium]|nr:hypothetical protein [Nitrospinaceae bacterium]
MEPQATISDFLHRIRQLRLYSYILHGIYIVLTYIVSLSLLACLAVLSYEPIIEWAFPIVVIFCIGLAYIIYNYFIKTLTTPFSNDDAALLTELNFPEINNSLINSSQLSRHLNDSHFKNSVSLDLIEELQKRTRKELDKIDPSAVINQNRVIFSRNLFLGVLGSLLLITIFIPELLTKGYERWTTPEKLAQASQKKISNKNQKKPSLSNINYSIESLGLSFYFPSYTGKNPEFIKPADGSIHVLPGTEAIISAKTNSPVMSANLIFSEQDILAMKKENNTSFNSSLLVKEKGFYQFKIKDPMGEERLIPKKYPVTLAKDLSPNIVLFLANPKPVYFNTDKVQLFYEGTDDFGISTVNLVFSINSKTNRTLVKKYKNQDKETKGNYKWSLAQIAINPGDEVSYYLEINDNDNIFGPNKGQSETYSFKIFDSEQEMENLVEMQEELTEKMITLLATGLVKGASLKNQPNNLIGWKQLLTINIDKLIKIVSLTQRIHDRGKTIDQFPQHYLDLLKNITRGLSQIRKSHIKALSDLQSQIHKPSQATLKATSPYSPVNNQMTAHLEKDILFLVKITNKQKLNRAKTLEEELNNLTQALREDLGEPSLEKSSKTSKELKNKINKIQKVLQKLMGQLSRQTKSMPDEFLNPNAFKRLNMGKLSDALKKMQQMVSQGKFKEAMEELKKMEEDLKLLANKIHRADSEKESFLDPETVKTIDNGIKKLDQLQKRQQNLVETTSQMNQKLRQQQSQIFESQINKLFKDLMRDIDSILNIFKKDKNFLANHKTMDQMKNLIEQETETNRKVEKLREATVESSQSKKLDENFKKLNEERKKLSKLTEKKKSLQVDEPQRFKEALPQLQKKYNSLNRLAKLQDLNDFADIFKKVYPDVLRWQYKLRTAINLRDDIAKKLEGDLTQVSKINNSISKKLGSMIRSIKKNYNSSITMDQKKELKKMEKQEYEIRKESQKLSQSFSELGKENPMIPSELSQGMKQTERHMEQAEKNLKEQNISKSIKSENLSLKGLNKTRDLLSNMKNSNGETSQAKRQNSRKLGTGSSPDSRRGGASRMQKERVILPDENQYKAPKEFREEILSAMKKKSPKDYERMIMKYYKDLVQ